MATKIALRHGQSGLTKIGFYGFSWTTLFFGMLPALFRADFLTFVGGLIVCVILAVTTFGIGNFIAFLVWAFMYNKYYTTNLIEKGYAIDESAPNALEAKAALGIAG
jgi:hypothetical protein